MLLCVVRQSQHRGGEDRRSRYRLGLCNIRFPWTARYYRESINFRGDFPFPTCDAASTRFSSVQDEMNTVRDACLPPFGLAMTRILDKVLDQGSGLRSDATAARQEAAVLLFERNWPSQPVQRQASSLGGRQNAVNYPVPAQAMFHSRNESRQGVSEAVDIELGMSEAWPPDKRMNCHTISAFPGAREFRDYRAALQPR
jgi:hypothetical protein